MADPFTIGALAISAVQTADSINRGNRAERNANAGRARARASAQKSVDFHTKQWNSWNEMYGLAEANNADYYNNLTPNKLIALGLEDLQVEYQKAKEEVLKGFAERGIQESDLATYTVARAEFDLARSQAEVRVGAREEVQRQKQGFLTLGLDEKNRISNNLTNAQNTLTEIDAVGSTNDQIRADNERSGVNDTLSGVARGLGEYGGYRRGQADAEKQLRPPLKITKQPPQFFGGTN